MPRPQAGGEATFEKDPNPSERMSSEGKVAKFCHFSPLAQPIMEMPDSGRFKIMIKGVETACKHQISHL